MAEEIAAGREAAVAQGAGGWSVGLPDDPVGGRAALGARPIGANLAGVAGLDREPELLLERAGDGAADRVMLPAGGRGDLLGRNSALPEKVPAGGPIILRDGDPGEPEQALGGFGSRSRSMSRRAMRRRATLSSTPSCSGAALEPDPTLTGLAFGLTYRRPEPAIEAIAGAPAIKTATLTVTVDYETVAPLA
jgi:hypothetical protein